MKKCGSHYTCGPLYSTHCIQYEGPKLTSVEDSRFTCDVRETDVIRELDRVVKILQDSVSLKDFPISCLSVKNEDTVRTLLEKLVPLVCTLQESLKNLEEKSQSNSVANLVIGANLACLTDGCTTADTRTLKQILEILASELCALKVSVTDIKTTGSSGTNLYIP